MDAQSGSGSVTTVDLVENAIAIVGMSGRFPDAPSPRELWANVRAGHDAIRRFNETELKDAYTDEIRQSPNFVKARPVLDGVEMFDPEFFGIRTREAELMDPQHRLFIECCWEALEDAGHDPHRFAGSVGVFAGCSMNTYFLNNVCADRSLIEQFTSGFQVDNYAMLTGSAPDFLATRTAYKLDLKGPAVNVATACSTSLVAVAQACQSLLFYQSDMALAGGVSISFPQERGYLSQEGGMVSTDGHCRPFDAKASGTVFGSGCGVVLLKRLEDAVADRDHIYAVIRGFAINNDGASKVGFAAPSVDGQAAVIAMAHAAAGISARSVGYVEAHGTATPLGDPIEFAGLVKAFGETTDERQFCVLGTTKANVGHLDAAAGVTGLIRTALSLTDRVIPPLHNFEKSNSAIDLADSPFVINREERTWTTGYDGEPRRAGVSSFGVGGTNVHLVLEEAPPQTKRSVTAKPVLLTLSARTENELTAARERLADYLEAGPAPLADIAFTLQAGRREFPWRSAVAATDHADAKRRLRAPGNAAKIAASPPEALFMFPGQGSQYPGMGRDLYETERVFSSHFDAGAEIVKASLGEDLGKLLYRDSPPVADDAPHPIRSTVFAQPALFVVEHALAKLWISRGLSPAAMLGHSVGEWVAACLSGVLSFEDAMTAVMERARLMQSMPQGGMLGVRASENVLHAMLPRGVDIAAINAPSLCVASGPLDALRSLEAALDAQNILHRRLHTSHAFHSAMIEPMVAPFQRALARLRFNAPKIPFVSCVTGDWITDQEAVSPTYWARHAREPVRFEKALRSAVERFAKPVLLEVGPGRTLSTFAMQTLPRDATEAIIASLPDATSDDGGELTFLDAQGALWMAGVKVDLPALHDFNARRVALPTYPFTRKRCWIDPPPSGRNSGGSRSEASTANAQAIPSNTSSFAYSEAITDPLTTTSPVLIDKGSSMKNFHTELALLLEELSGESISGVDPATSFLELGFDSLFLAQFATRLQKAYGVKITFRQLLNDIPSISALAAYLDANAAAPRSAPAASPAAAGETTDLQTLLRTQIAAMENLFAQQRQLLQTSGQALPQNDGRTPAKTIATLMASDVAEAPSRFQVYRTGASHSSDLNPSQKKFIGGLIEKANTRTPTAKKVTQEYRRKLADPRTASGFRAEWKELIYPIVCARSKGSKIWDLDGNVYVDLVNGYGQTMFGHAPDFVTAAIAEQMAQGFAIGPQSPLAGEVASMLSDMTGNERVTFCNTGSEAVMAAMRVARAVTGRDKIAMFTGAYHGQFDEVLARPGGKSIAPRALPVAPGIPGQSVSNILVLPYGTSESLEWVRKNIDELAAVIIEPVQSRHPELQPREFANELRSITEQNETALVFDEVVTGFRVHQGGMQALWNIRADLATYGKVLGGGMPIGVLAGKPRFMDALDGGFWRFGDDSVPEVAPTFFAGTFVRHPLVLAAAHAVLTYLKNEGPALQDRLGARTADLAARLNGHLERRDVQTRIGAFSSWFYMNFSAEDHLSGLMFQNLRLLGVNAQEGFPCFLTTAHTDGDIDLVASTFEQTIDTLQSVDILAGKHGAPAHKTGSSPVNAILQDNLGEDCPVTESQREIWLAAQLSDEASCAFNESISVTFDGLLDEAALRMALNDVVARHDALRGSFGGAGERLKIARDLRVDLPLTDLSQETSDEALRALAAIVDADARTPFDLENGPLVRARLMKLYDTRHVLVFTAHHIICDGWSFNVILEDLSQCYGERKAGRTPALKPALQFRTYATRKSGSPETTHDTEDFWLKLYAEPVPVLDLPYDRPRPAIKTFRGATLSAALDGELIQRVKKAGAKQGCTLFTVLFSAVQTLMARLSGENDVVLLVPAAGQNLLDDEVLVGHCVNFLPMRASVNPDAPFSDHLRAAKAHVLAAFDHQDYTLGTLIKELGLPRDFGRTPLSDIQFNLERTGAKTPFAALQVDVSSNPKAFVNFDLFINMVELDAGVRVDVDYSTDLFDETTIARLIGHLRTLLHSIAEDCSQKAGDLDLLTGDEKRWLIYALNDTETPVSTNMTPALIAAMTAVRPHASALRFAGKTYDFAWLEARATQFASAIVKSGARKGDRVAIALERSPDLVCALLGAWKAGCAYVPLDPEHPPLRLAQTMREAKVALLICDTDAIAQLAPASAKAILARTITATSPSELPAALPHPQGDDTAYVIFTSGSTGTPKGVEVSHRALVNLLSSMQSRIGVSNEDKLLAVTTVSFDIAALELFLPLVCGAEVIISTREQVRDGFDLAKIAGEPGVSMMQATPSLWAMLNEAGFTARDGFKMLCGGEALPKDLARKLLAGGGILWNVYGPTETTIWSSAGQITMDMDPIVIGAPLDNTQLFVFDKRGQLAPVGVSGELLIGGEGLAKGYFAKPDLTAAAFVSLAIDGKPRRLYRTGDLARRLKDGSIQVLGRRDHQVKLRGFRIELEDIETTVRGISGVSDCAAAVMDVRGTPALVCFYKAAANGPRDETVLAAECAKRLPDYMVPSIWRRLDTLPRTFNGKLDRKALTKVEVAPKPKAMRSIRAPASELEQKIARIWAEILRLDRVDADDNIIALGADSLQIFRAASRMMSEGIDLQAKHIWRHPTVAALASAAVAQKMNSGPSISQLPSLASYRRGARRDRD